LADGFARFYFGDLYTKLNFKENTVVDDPFFKRMLQGHTHGKKEK
jgi:hypothetical protein